VTKTKSTFSPQTIALQGWLRPELTPVKANVDYSRFKEDLDRISANLRDGWLEAMAIEHALEDMPADAPQGARARRAEWAVFALRAEVLRHLLGLPSFRAYSRMLAGSDLLTDFCGVRTLEGIKWTSKSTLERASKLFDEAGLERLNRLLAELVGNDDWSATLGLEERVDATVCLMDTTCLEANVHHPVDWLLLKDIGVTLLKAVGLIRREGLVCRMPGGPEQAWRDLNRLCMEMIHSRRKKDAGKIRKRVLRKMKALTGRIAEHARRHRDRLVSEGASTRWTLREAANIVARIDDRLALLPEAVRQAHERMIGGRPVDSRDKILSAHEREIEVIVRGKAGRETEFGNALFISESSDGFIFDYKLYRRGAPADAVKPTESLERQQAFLIDQPIEEVVGDRAFQTKATARALEEAGIIDSNCPKDPAELKRRMEDPRFRQSQKRRGSTEARIAILKNNGGGRVCRAKGFDNRATAVGWGVLSHNLWWIARKIRERREEEESKAA